MNSVVQGSVFVSEILWFELTKGRNEKEIGETGKNTDYRQGTML